MTAALNRRSIYFGYLGCTAARLTRKLLLGVTSILKELLLSVTFLSEDTLHLAMLVDMGALVILPLRVDRVRLRWWVALRRAHMALS